MSGYNNHYIIIAYIHELSGVVKKSNGSEAVPNTTILPLAIIHTVALRTLVSIYHCKKLLLIYSKSDCKYTVIFAVGKYTAMITVKLHKSYCNYGNTEWCCIFTVTVAVKYGNKGSTRGRKCLASETFLVLPDFSGLIITNTHLIYVIINELMH